MRSTLMRTAAIGAALAIFLSACGGAAAPAPAATSAAPATAAATPKPTPKFDVTSYMYALTVKGKIRIGTQEDNPPFSRKDPATNTWQGFDVEVGREVAKAIYGENADLNKVIEWVPVTSATRIPSLTDNKADVIIKTFTINEERKKQIDFSDVYFRTGQKILVKKDNTTIKGVADLTDKTVCTQKGSTSEKNITAANAKAKLLQLDSYPACLLALQQGQADAVSTDETILFGLVGQDKNTKIVGDYFSTEPYGIGVAKQGRTGFVPFLNTVIAAMIKDGRWAKLYKQYITPVSGDVKENPDDKGKPSG